MGNDITGIGAKFERHDGSDYVEIARVFNIQGPSMSRDAVEVTAYDSAGGWREKIGGLRDGGQLTFSLNFRRANYLTLKGDFENDDTVQYQIVIPDSSSTTISFDGLITELPLAIPEGDRVTIDVTIEISGSVDDDST